MPAELKVECEDCGHVYLAIVKNGGVGWINQIMRDARMHWRSAKRHLQHLLDLNLIEHTVPGIYQIKKQH